jgi:hypothetical protein
VHTVFSHGQRALRQALPQAKAYLLSQGPHSRVVYPYPSGRQLPSRFCVALEAAFGLTVPGADGFPSEYLTTWRLMRTVIGHFRFPRDPPMDLLAPPRRNRCGMPLPVNVLVCGPRGAGKSQLIATFLTLMNDSSQVGRRGLIIIEQPVRRE